MILEPTSLGQLDLQSRLVCLPHQTNFSFDGRVTDRHVAYYERRARSRPGLMVIGPIDVDRRFAVPGRLLSELATAEGGFARIAAATKPHGVLLIGQLSDGGRSTPGDTTLDWVPELGPSAVSPALGARVPVAMSPGQIEAKVELWEAAVERLRAGGFAGVELDAGSGLLADFIDPAANLRKDGYGGSPQARLRLLSEIAAAARGAGGPGFLIGLRLRLACSPTRLENGDPLTVVGKMLAAERLDYASVQVAGGRELVDPLPTLAVAARTALVDARRQLGVPIVAGGGVVSPAVAEELLDCGAADLVGVGRGLIADPDWLAKVRAEEIAEIRPCIGCDEGCAGRLALGRPLTCILNPEAGREASGEVAPAPPDRALRVLVVGGGPGGMACAGGAAAAGHAVTLVERAPRLGGAMRAIARPGFETGLKWLERTVGRAGVVVALATECDPGTVEVGPTGVATVGVGADIMVFDVIAVATGAAWGASAPAGVDPAPACAAELLGGGEDEVGRRVTIATEAEPYAAVALAATLDERGREVALVTSERALASTLDPVNRAAALGRIFGAGIEVRTELRLTAVGPTSATFEDTATGALTELDADTLVVSRPPQPDEGLYLRLKAAGANVVRLGDCVAPRDVANAIYEGERVGRSL